MSPRSEDLNQRMREQATGAILRSALELFTEKGFHTATIAEVAARAGVSKGLIYNYFRSKDDLLQAIVQERQEELLHTLRAAPPDTPPAERLRRAADLFLEDVARRPEHYRLYLSLLLQPAASPAVERAAETLKPRFMETYGVLHEVFRALGRDDPVAETFLFVAALNGLALNLIIQPELTEKPGEFPLAAIRARLLDTFTTPRGEDTP
jgi:AcrR family transcriptional regulator